MLCFGVFLLIPKGQVLFVCDLMSSCTSHVGVPFANLPRSRILCSIHPSLRCNTLTANDPCQRSISDVCMQNCMCMCAHIGVFLFSLFLYFVSSWLWLALDVESKSSSQFGVSPYRVLGALRVLYTSLFFGFRRPRGGESQNFHDASTRLCAVCSR